MLTFKKLIYILTLLFTFASIGNILQAQSQNKYSDAEVAHIAVTANKIDVETAKLAKKKSNHSDVIDFANTMIRDHNCVIQKAVELTQELGVEPKENSLSQKLMDDAKSDRSMLKNKSGDDFNEAYINHEVKYHEAVITVIKDVLIPNTKNADLKNLLKGVLPALETHLEQAENIQEKLNSNDSY